MRRCRNSMPAWTSTRRSPARSPRSTCRKQAWSSKPGGHLLGRCGSPEQEALHVVAAAGAQEGELVLGLDTLGDDAEFGRAPDAQRGLDDPAVALAGGAGDEAAVELDPGQRQVGEAGQARVAGPEVVEVDLQTELGEASEPRDGRVAALHQRRLG